MVRLAYLFSAFAAYAVNAVPTDNRRSYLVKETHHAPRQWEKIERAPATHVIDLHIGVRQGKFEELEKRLFEGNQPFAPQLLLVSH